MLSTRFSALPALRAVALLAVAGAASPPAAGTARGSPSTTASRSTRTSRCGWRCWCRSARATRAARRSGAAWSTPRSSRRRTCATPPSTSWSTPTPAPPTAAPRRRARRWPRARRSSSGRSSAPPPPARSRSRPGAGLTVLSFSNNASVAGQNVYVLGNTFDNTADRLVGYGLSRGPGELRAWSTRSGSRARAPATRWRARWARRGGTLVELAALQRLGRGHPGGGGAGRRAR